MRRTSAPYRFRGATYHTAQPPAGGGEAGGASAPFSSAKAKAAQDAAEELMNGAGITYTSSGSGQMTTTPGTGGATVEEDGIDLPFNVSGSNWGSIPGKLTFDFNLRKDRPKLNEVHFELCRRAYIGNNGGRIKRLFRAIAILQKAKTRPEAASADWDDDEEAVEMLSYHVYHMLQGGVEVPRDKGLFIKALNDAILQGADKTLYTNMAQTAQKLDETSWDEMWERLDNDSAVVPTRDLAWAAIKPFLAGEFAGDKEDVQVIGVDHRNDTFQLTVTSPIPMSFEFHRQPNASADFVRGSLCMCKAKGGRCAAAFETEDATTAKQLVTAMVDFYDAARITANPQVSKPYKDIGGKGEWDERSLRAAMQQGLLVQEMDSGALVLRIKNVLQEYTNRNGDPVALNQGSLGALWAGGPKSEFKKKIKDIQHAFYLDKDGTVYLLDMETGAVWDKVGTYGRRQR